VSTRPLALAALALCSGCVMYPRQGARDVGQQRGFASAADVSALEPGCATRADVVCALGEPDFVFEGGRYLAYWTREGLWEGWWLTLERTWWGRDHVLYFVFDDRGRLSERHTARRTFEAGSFPGWLDESEARRMVDGDLREHGRKP